MDDFIQILWGDSRRNRETPQPEHHTVYGLVPQMTASSAKDSIKSKQGETKQQAKITSRCYCTAAGGTYHTFNKSGTWEKSSALAKLKAKLVLSQDQPKLRFDSPELAKPIELLKRSEKAKGKKGTTVPLDDGRGSQCYRR